LVHQAFLPDDFLEHLCSYLKFNCYFSTHRNVRCTGT